ncbi:methyl-accepting chemotaxis protein [Vogesella sp. GCM10023246]|uniref:Methyl-accepting chemotaxis protein n=1 Tax=Vogesella oryzagri TaxID=3160864 RepID=A0ABV1M2H5_9NEIS
MLNRLSLKSQMWLLLGVPCLALLLVIAVALFSASRLHSHTGAMYENTAKPLRAMAEVASRVPRMRVGIDVMLLQETPLRDDKGVAGRIRDAREEDIPAMRKALEDAVAAQVDPAARERAQALLQTFQSMEREALLPLLAALEAGNLDGARALYKGAYVKHYNAMRGDTNKMLDSLVAGAAVLSDASAEAYDAARTRMLLISGAALLLAVLLGVAIMRYMERRVRRLQQQMTHAASELALQTRSDLGGVDELARIASSYNQLMSSLEQAIGGVQRFTGEVQQTAAHVAGSAERVTAASASQSSAAQSVAASVQQVAVSVQHVADATALTAQLSESLQQRAELGKGTLEETSASIQRVSDGLQSAAAQTRALADNSENIRGIVDSIRDIADQTNLLALNAAIEAARAGELGRGFAVVADEVRKLAERTTQATAEVGQLLSGIQGQIHQVAGQVQGSVSQVQDGRQLVQQASALMQEISSESGRAAQGVRSVADSSREQGMAAEAIAQSVEQIVQMAEQNHHEIGAAQHSAVQLQQLAQALGREVARFSTAA